eukprot:6199812-Pleurochrysis_carterae.AAC.1
MAGVSVIKVVTCARFTALDHHKMHLCSCGSAEATTYQYLALQSSVSVFITAFVMFRVGSCKPAKRMPGRPCPSRYSRANHPPLEPIRICWRRLTLHCPLTIVF